MAVEQRPHDPSVDDARERLVLVLHDVLRHEAALSAEALEVEPVPVGDPTSEADTRGAVGFLNADGLPLRDDSLLRRRMELGVAGIDHRAGVLETLPVGVHLPHLPRRVVPRVLVHNALAPRDELPLMQQSEPLRRLYSGGSVPRREPARRMAGAGCPQERLQSPQVSKDAHCRSQCGGCGDVLGGLVLMTTPEGISIDRLSWARVARRALGFAPSGVPLQMSS
mmetsp:Transcript_47170/g.151194  ORF Transcript_47170/g.151194 Transcript_47170/m.151194 type:complete len:224 (-) Transcript_47170:15-686(-)